MAPGNVRNDSEGGQVTLSRMKEPVGGVPVSLYPGR